MVTQTVQSAGWWFDFNFIPKKTDIKLTGDSNDYFEKAFR